MRKKAIHPFIKAMQQRRQLMSRLLLGLDPAYKIALTNIDDAQLADAVIATPRLQGRMLRRFAQAFELPERPDVPDTIAELLQEAPQLWPELMKAAGLLLHFRRLPPVLMKNEMEQLAHLFGKRVVGTIFHNRNFAPSWDSHMRLSIDQIDMVELYEDGARSLRLWAKERMGEMIGWFTPLLPPAVGEDIDMDIDAGFEDAIDEVQTGQSKPHMPSHHAHAMRLNPEDIQQRIAMIDLLLPLVRTIVQEKIKSSHTETSLALPQDEPEEVAA